MDLANQARLDNAEKLIQVASQLSQKNDMGTADRRLDEAGKLLADVVGPESDRRLDLAAAVQDGKGQVALSTGNAEAAYFHLSEALGLRQRLADSQGTRNHLAEALCHMNISSSCSQLKKGDEALAHAQMAVQQLDKAVAAGVASGDAQRLGQTAFIRIAALQGLGTICASHRRFDDAIGAFQTAIEQADGFAEAPAQLQIMTCQLRINAAICHHQRGGDGDTERAIDLGEAASDESWRRLEASQSQPQSSAHEALTQYVTAQMNQLSFYESASRFADAEDALFRVIKLVGPQANILERGMAFYNGLLDVDDAALDAGNLPRDEVQESLAELRQLAAATATQSATA